MHESLISNAVLLTYNLGQKLCLAFSFTLFHMNDERVIYIKDRKKSFKQYNSYEDIEDNLEYCTTVFISFW